MGYSGEEQREYQRNLIKDRREEWLTKNGPCQKCGTWKNLEIDHIVPRSVKPARKPSAIWMLKEKTREKELSRCQVLCKDSHWEKTKKDLGHGEHGSVSMYRKGGCRCDLCRGVHNRLVNEWRWRTGRRKKRGG